MNALNFAYWLQGLFEVGNPKTLDEQQVEMIKRHLGLVFENVTADPAPILRPAQKPARLSEPQPDYFGKTLIYC